MQAVGAIELPVAKAKQYGAEQGRKAAGADFAQALNGLGGIVRKYSRQAYLDGYTYAFHPDE